MKREDIIAMAREAGGLPDPMVFIGAYERFAARVAAAEREACAKLCRSEAERALWNFQNDLPQNESFWNGAEQMASSCENAIRARWQA
jgi:hypothetical protein